MTDQWDFVIAAYALSAVLTAAVLWSGWRAMARAERRANAMKRTGA